MHRIGVQEDLLVAGMLHVGRSPRNSIRWDQSRVAAAFEVVRAGESEVDSKDLYKWDVYVSIRKKNSILVSILLGPRINPYP